MLSFTSKLKKFTLTAIAVGAMGLASQAQQPGKFDGNAANFFDTAPFGGQLAELQFGAFGDINPGNKWIGIGNPTAFPFGPPLPVYGFRIQDDGDAATISINDNGTGAKDFELQWGSDINSRFNINFIQNPFMPGSALNVLTAVGNGRVGINQDSPDFVLDVVANNVNGDPVAIRANNFNPGSQGIYSTGEEVGVFAESRPNAGFGGMGVLSQSGGNSGTRMAYFGSASSTNGDAYGIFVEAGTNTGTSYGIYSNAGAGSGTAFAGFFDGDVEITGSLFVTSDQRLKQDIETEENVMDRIMALRPTTYTFREDGMAAKLNLAQGQQHGFIAQELEQVFPELIKEATALDGVQNMDEGMDQKVDRLTFKSVNYVSLIPILTAGIQEQQATIEAQEAENKSLLAKVTLLEDRLAALEAQSSDKSGANSILNSTGSVLFQNSPNPFDAETRISYQLEGQYTNAEIIVFDMNGRQMRVFNQLERGESSVTLQGNDLEAGMYFYSLIVDGQEVATKRMILTK